MADSNKISLIPGGPTEKSDYVPSPPNRDTIVVTNGTERNERRENFDSCEPVERAPVESFEDMLARKSREALKDSAARRKWEAERPRSLKELGYGSVQGAREAAASQAEAADATKVAKAEAEKRIAQQNAEDAELEWAIFRARRW